MKLVPNEQVVEVDEFESTITLADVDGGTDLVGVYENLPPGLSPSNNETGWRMALDKLAAMLEREQ